MIDWIWWVIGCFLVLCGVAYTIWIQIKGDKQG